MAISLRDYPVYPICDDMIVTKEQTKEQIDWLVKNGTLFRERSGEPTTDGQCEESTSLEEVVFSGGVYCFISYAPSYQADEHDQYLVTIRKYETLEFLLEKEQMDDFLDARLADSEHWQWGPIAWWKWTEYGPTVLHNGGVI